MTTVYFIRHAEPDFSNHDDKQRPLTRKGIKDRKRVSEYLEDKAIDIVLSSPYRRAIETVEDFAQLKGLDIVTIDDFRERKVDSCWIEDFDQFSRSQWADFSYKLNDGECLMEVQERNIKALMEVIDQYKDKNIVIGSLGTALSTVINCYDSSYEYEDFQQMRHRMPWIVKFTFDGKVCQQIEKIDVL
ncbi:MAG TPA: histidine phosphatase family protein [Lachnospiraceae bacterium]|nr:histidine phosphatase family protein [Lachnospiraceae bacterium]